MTNLEQQDIEAFKSWANGTNPAVNPSYYQTWQAALAYERGKSGWRSIETAPKDNRDVILVAVGDFVTTAWWCKYDSLGGGNWLDEGRRIVANVTHWMPLPSPPATQP